MADLGRNEAGFPNGSRPYGLEFPCSWGRSSKASFFFEAPRRSANHMRGALFISRLVCFEEVDGRFDALNRSLCAVRLEFDFVSSFPAVCARVRFGPHPIGVIHPDYEQYVFEIVVGRSPRSSLPSFAPICRRTLARRWR